jgi:hypothetical protein
MVGWPSCCPWSLERTGAMSPDSDGIRQADGEPVRWGNEQSSRMDPSCRTSCRAASRKSRRTARDQTRTPLTQTRPETAQETRRARKSRRRRWKCRVCARSARGSSARSSPRRQCRGSEPSIISLLLSTYPNRSARTIQGIRLNDYAHTLSQSILNKLDTTPGSRSSGKLNTRPRGDDRVADKRARHSAARSAPVEQCLRFKHFTQ